MNISDFVPVNDETPPLLVCGVRSGGGPAVVYYNFEPERHRK